MSPERIRKRRSKKVARRDLLVAACEELIAGDGELEVANVAKRAGVSDGLTYYHFKNKAGLLSAIVQDFFERLDDTISAVPYEGRTWEERERLRVYEFVEFFYTDEVASIVFKKVRTDPLLSKEEREREKRLNRLGARNIAQAQRDGEIDPAHDPLLLVSMILGGVIAGIGEALAMTPPKPLHEAQSEIWAFVARAAGLSHST